MGYAVRVLSPSSLVEATAGGAGVFALVARTRRRAEPLGFVHYRCREDFSFELGALQLVELCGGGLLAGAEGPALVLLREALAVAVAGLQRRTDAEVIAWCGDAHPFVARVLGEAGDAALGPRASLLRERVRSCAALEESAPLFLRVFHRRQPR